MAGRPARERGHSSEGAGARQGPGDWAAVCPSCTLQLRLCYSSGDENWVLESSAVPAVSEACGLSGCRLQKAAREDRQPPRFAPQRTEPTPLAPPCCLCCTP